MLVLDRVSFAYKKTQPLLRDICLTVEQGEHVGIMGPSGSGKSTLLKIINGTIEAGRFQGTYQRPDGLRFGSVYQNLDNQIIFPNVLDELVFGMENLCYSKKQMDEKLARVTRLLGIDHLVGEETGHLSGGEKQRVIMASILCLDVDVLILDECLSQVDAKGKTRILQAVDALRTKAVTVLMVDHEKAHLKNTDRCYQVKDGRLRRM